MTIAIKATVALLCFWVSLVASASEIRPGQSWASSRHLDSPSRPLTSDILEIFEFSQIIPEKQVPLPGFSNPLGTAIVSGTRVFSGKLHFFDVLGDNISHSGADSQDIELPSGALAGIKLLDDLDALYYSYDGRAFDKSLWDLSIAKVIMRDDLPVTSETGPLSLSGYGSVSTHFKPYDVHWTQCPSLDKREFAMTKAIKKRRGPCSIKGVCQCFNHRP
jgi:hypothetical protein